MDGKFFCMGLALGMLGGALIVANSNRVRNAVKNSQQQILDKAEELSKECNQNKKESEKQ